MKWAKKLFTWLFLILLIVVASGSAISYMMRDKIVDYLKSEINKQLIAEINVESIDFTVWKQFPMAALEFTQVTAHDSKSKATVDDTLFHFEKVYLAFNIEDIYNEKYTIRSIALKNGAASLHTDKNDKSNYIFWKETPDDTTQTQFAVALEKVTLENVEVNWFHQKRKENISLKIPKITAKGKFSDKEHSTALYGEAYINKLQLDNSNYLEGEKVKLDIGFEVGEYNNFQISRGLLSLRKKYDFDIKGKVNGNVYQFDIAGKNLDLNAIRELVPAKHLESTKDYDGQGKVDFHCLIERPKNKTRQKITAEFEVKDSKIKHKPSGYTIEQLSLKGAYTNGNKMSPWTSELTINDLNAVLKSGNIKGNLKMRNFKRPNVQLHLDAAYAVEDFLQFFPSDTIESATGNVQFDVDFSGIIQNPDTIKPQDLIKAKVSGHLNLTDFAFKLKKDQLEYNNFNTKLELKNNSVTVHELNGNIANTDIALKGKFTNFLPWLFYKTETLSVQANLKSNHVNLDQLLSGEEKSASSEEYQLHLPRNIKSDIQFNIGKLNLEKLLAENIKGRLRSNFNTLRFSDISLDALQGNVKGDLKLVERRDGDFNIASNGQLSNIDINQLFIVFDNFGQNSIKAEHLKGTANSKYAFKALLKNDLHVDMNTLDITADLTINKGELIGYKPLMSITKDFNENKILRLFIKLDDFNERLKHIHFSKLQNTFRIKDQTLSIPAMKIASSALDINVAGTHTFDNKIDYLLDFNLKQILTRKEKIKDTEYGYIKDDGTGNKMIFLKVTGTVDNPDISLNRKASSAHSKAIIQKEIFNAKKILKEEFNLSNDKNKRNDEPIQEADFELDLGEFEEEEEKQGDKKTKPNTTQQDTTNQKGLKKLLKKMTKEQKEEKSKFEEWEFEDDDF